MVLPGYALMAQGTQIHVAVWPFAGTMDPSSGSGLLLSRAFAMQGSCYVIATCALLKPDDVPEAYRELFVGRNEQYGESQGRCCIIAPGGKVIAEAELNEETILTASVSLEAVFQAKGIIDVAGHYSRPDVLRLLINRRPLERIVESDSNDRFMPAAPGNAILSDYESRASIERETEQEDAQ